MPILEEKKIENKPKDKKDLSSKRILTLNNYFDDYFGLFIAGGVLLVLVCSFLFLIYPRFNDAIDTISAADTLLEEEKTAINLYKNRIERYIDDYNAISDDDKLKVNDMIAAKHLYPSIYHTDLVIMLTNLITSNGFTLSELDVSQSAKREVATKNKKVRSQANNKVASLPPGVLAVNVKVSFEDISYSDLKSLLTLLENRQRLIDVIDVSFDDEAQTAEMGLTTYSFIHEDSI